MGGSMARIALILSVLFFVAPPVFAESNSHGHAPAALQPKGTTAVTLQGDALVLTFGPIDLPARHSGNLASSLPAGRSDRKRTHLNSSHVRISYAVFCFKKKKHTQHMLHLQHC